VHGEPVDHADLITLHVLEPLAKEAEERGTHISTEHSWSSPACNETHLSRVMFLSTLYWYLALSSAGLLRYEKGERLANQFA
jgi:hypothetical protein